MGPPKLVRDSRHVTDTGYKDSVWIVSADESSRVKSRRSGLV